MKFIAAIISGMLLFTACKTEEKPETPEVEKTASMHPDRETQFGEGVKAASVVLPEDMSTFYEGMEPADTLAVAFEATVTEVCQMKGCWMKLDLGNGQTAMVTFKDYGFFMPKDLAGTRVVVEGSAFIKQMSVEDQRHYAEDAGKPAEEVKAITEPEKTFSFIASGVAIK